jgi:hypothetical protein
MAVSFAQDIAPMFKPFDVNMAWRFGLTTYDDVKANAALIYSRMTNGSSPMPPPPYPPFTAEQVALFNQWMLDGYQP